MGSDFHPIVAMSVFLDVDYTFEKSCCDNLLVKSLNKQFKRKDGLGVFSMCLDADFQPIVKYGACTFQNKETQAYLYRAKYGNWVVGTVLGKIKKGAIIRSHGEESDKFTRCCPCMTHTQTKTPNPRSSEP